MTTTAHEDQFTAAPEPVREPMSREAILRRSVADLELALKQQTERAEAAEAELAKLAQQKPVVMLNLSHDGSDFEMFYDLSDLKFNSMRMPLYAAPVPAPHKGATHCDDCGLTWLDDGLNPLRCPYCKDPVPAPAVPSVVFMAHNKTSSILFAARKDADQYAASFGPAAGVSVTECAVIGSQSAPQAPAVPEFCAVEAQLTLAEIIRNARRYLALRENEVIIMQAADPDFDAEGYRARYDAAADRLLEGGV